MPTEGGPSFQLTDHPDSDLTPSWSPDGREIAFHSARTGASDIFVVPAEGGEPRQITHDRVRSFLGQWSPKGEWITFTSNREDGVRRLWRVPASGGAPERLTNGPGTWFRWSPDGRRVYYKRDFEISELWAVTIADGTEAPVTRLLDRPGALGNFAVGEEHLYFTWRNDLGDLWVMDVVNEQEP
jgi:TolB protein